MGQHYSVLKEILMITFSLWCKGLLTNLMRTCAQKGKIVCSRSTQHACTQIQTMHVHVAGGNMGMLSKI